MKENHTLRDRNDPETRWRCCSLWQRTLSNKWNAREFALRHGCQVPELYWSGRHIGAVPIESFPEHFVVRPIWGAARRNVFVMAGDLNLLTATHYTRRALAQRLIARLGRFSRFPLLVEEFVRTEAGAYELPTEYKLHMFGETVGAIQVVHRPAGRKPATHRFYEPSWRPFPDRMNTMLEEDDLRAPPACFDDILTCARRLGAAYETYVRVDCYATDRGCVFGEFASTPVEGANFTPFADRYFESLWQQAFGERT
ncbi:MAG TPA: ATP-grasp fold amidoligase family protein [Candidatus Binatia bacterium]|nr:ATP-grasp fold amidoligase family protein [Candidatus Binatia bacterium]